MNPHAWRNLFPTSRSGLSEGFPKRFRKIPVMVTTSVVSSLGIHIEDLFRGWSCRARTHRD